MFNLLPENLKEKIKKEYKIRRLSVIFMFVILFQLSFLIFLVPSWLISKYKETEVVLKADEIQNSSLINDTNSASYVIKSTNSKLTIINSVMKYVPFTPSFDTILSSKNSSIHLSEITYVSTGSSTANILLGGISSTREALVLFVKNLKESESFKSIDLPVSNLAKDKNIDFSITITLGLNK